VANRALVHAAAIGRCLGTMGGGSASISEADDDAARPAACCDALRFRLTTAQPQMDELRSAVLLDPHAGFAQEDCRPATLRVGPVHHFPFAVIATHTQRLAAYQPEASDQALARV